jgi:hypothetical protein
MGAGRGPRTPIGSWTGSLWPWPWASWAYRRGWRGRGVRPLRAAVTAVLRSDCMACGVGGAKDVRACDDELGGCRFPLTYIGQGVLAQRLPDT